MPLTDSQRDALLGAEWDPQYCEKIDPNKSYSIRDLVALWSVDYDNVRRLIEPIPRFPGIKRNRKWLGQTIIDALVDLAKRERQ